MSSAFTSMSLQHLKLKSKPVKVKPKKEKPARPASESKPKQSNSSEFTQASSPDAVSMALRPIEAEPEAAPQATQQLFKLLRLLPYDQPEEAIDACLLLSSCGGHGLGAQLAVDLHSAISATSGSLVQQTRWFLGCAVLVANAGTLTRLEKVSQHNSRVVAAAAGAGMTAEVRGASPAYYILSHTKNKIRLRQVSKKLLE